MPRVETNKEDYDLLLTPQLYLLKRENLPVRFVFEARRIAPALMEELGADSSWAFEVFREGEMWTVIAYHPATVMEVLARAGVPPGRIGRIYFAQQFREQLSKPLLLSDREAMMTMDATVTMVPTSLAVNPTEKWTDPGSLRKPAKGFIFRGRESRKWLGGREFLWIGLILFLLGAVWIAEGIRYRSAISALEARLKAAAGNDPTLVSRITRKNIHDHYVTIDRRQRQIRETMRNIGQLISKDSKLSRLKIDSKGYEASIDAKKNRLRTLKKLADSSALPARIEGETLKVKGAWR